MIAVYTSTSADGNMLNRNDYQDALVIENRQRFFQKHNLPFERGSLVAVAMGSRISAKEQDFCRYREVTEVNFGEGMTGDAPISDALITRLKNHPLILPIADCVATTIYDPVNEVLMLSHLGRHSLEQQSAIKSVQYMVEQYGSNPIDLLVWTSPAPNKEVYPIWKLDNKGMKEVWFEQMAAAGIKNENITDNPADSATDLNYYSYSEYYNGRRQEDADFAMVAMMTD